MRVSRDDETAHDVCRPGGQALHNRRCKTTACRDSTEMRRVESAY